jgi:hypothetical protein
MKKEDFVISVVTGNGGIICGLDYNGIHKVYIFRTDSYEYLQHKEMKFYYIDYVH